MCRIDPERGETKFQPRVLVSYDFWKATRDLIGYSALNQSLYRLWKLTPRSIGRSKPERRFKPLLQIDTPRPRVKMPTTLKEFETVFPTLVKDLKEHCQKYKLPDQALDWFEKV